MDKKQGLERNKGIGEEIDVILADPVRQVNIKRVTNVVNGGWQEFAQKHLLEKKEEGKDKPLQ